MWRQIKDANWRVRNEGGWCLKFVQDAFSTDHPYPSATAAWSANYGNGNHPGELPPKGITVPVYFSLGNVPEGHVAISLDDGTVASTTRAGVWNEAFVHPSLQDLINVYAKYNGGCTYLGWSEYVGTQRVVEPINEGGTVDTIKSMYWRLLGREADQGGIDTYTKAAASKGWGFVYNDLKNSDEGQKDWAWRNPDAVRALEKKLASAESYAQKASLDLTSAAGELKKTKDDLATVSNNRDALETTVRSQAETIERLQDELNKKPTTGDYSWVNQLQAWLRGIFK